MKSPYFWPRPFIEALLERALEHTARDHSARFERACGYVRVKDDSKPPREKIDRSHVHDARCTVPYCIHEL
jgi:hypothetical protein